MSPPRGRWTWSLRDSTPLALPVEHGAQALGRMRLVELGGDAGGDLVRRSFGLLPLALRPRLQVGVGAGQALAHRRLVDRLLEPVGQRHLGGRAAGLAGGDHRRDLLPARDAILGHGARMIERSVYGRRVNPRPPPPITTA